jgi:autotransporter passenger strand-loop-strand repeat protein
MSGSTTIPNGVSSSGFTLSNGDQLFVFGTVSGTIISSGGIECVYAGGLAVSTTVSNGGFESVSGGTASFTTVSSGGSDVVVSGGSDVVVSGGTTVSTTVSNGGFRYVTFGGSATGTTVSSGGTEVLSSTGIATSTTVSLGGAIDVTSLQFVSGGTADLTSASVLSVTEGAHTYTQQLVGDYTGEFFHLSLDPLTGSGTLITLDGTPCYCRGTRILTDHGETAVEDLHIGDRVVTLSGKARPLRWIGTRSYAGRFAAGNRNVLPVLFRRDALAEGVPRRDLMVSPLHAMYLDDVLIPAAALVNGSTVVQLETVDQVDYFHLELETHDIILAEGAPSETFVDDDSRGMFHNAAECGRRRAG